MILVFCLIIQSYERQRIDEISMFHCIMGVLYVGIFPRLDLMQSTAEYKKLQKKILSMDRLEPSKSNNQAIGCLETITFVVSGLL